jgi:hypothetical protein
MTISLAMSALPPSSRETTAAGNGIFGCRDEAPKIVIQTHERLQRQNPQIEWPEIPAKTPYLASNRKRAVCKGWVVGTTGIEPVTPTMSR